MWHPNGLNCYFYIEFHRMKNEHTRTAVYFIHSKISLVGGENREKWIRERAPKTEKFASRSSIRFDGVCVCARMMYTDVGTKMNFPLPMKNVPAFTFTLCAQIFRWADRRHNLHASWKYHFVYRWAHTMNNSFRLFWFRAFSTLWWLKIKFGLTRTSVKPKNNRFFFGTEK